MEVCLGGLGFHPLLSVGSGKPGPGKRSPSRANGSRSHTTLSRRRADGSTQTTKLDAPFLADTQHVHVQAEPAVQVEGCSGNT